MISISPTLSNILVFKTNISSDDDMNTAREILSRENKIKCWNVDRGDVDNVLRVEGTGIEPQNIVDLFAMGGLQCEELPD